MHPNRFFDECAIRTGIDTAEIFDEEVQLVKKPKNIDELLDTCPANKTICDNMIRAWSIINRTDYKKILCSISGGADSDVMLDIIWKCDIHNKVDYMWFDTGL